MTEPTRPIPARIGISGLLEAFSVLTPTRLNVRAQISVPPSRAIPVILVPGMMGSNLRKIDDHRKKVWAPPNDTTDDLGAAASWGFKDPDERQLIFNPNEAEVDDSGLIEMPLDIPWLNAEDARNQRGWGTVHWKSYGPLLIYLEKHLNSVYVQRELQSEWRRMHKQQDKDRWGAQLRDKFAPVVWDELKRLPRAFYPVYAVGYNWLRSNNESAEALKIRIEEIINEWKQFFACEQVLIVTHSMGGFVTRRCAQLAPDKVLGIVHGVMPARGAAAAYKRMRAGFEGAPSLVLGWNEGEATAAMANTAGVLELLPQPDYNDGKPWLCIKAQGYGGGLYHEVKLPVKDAYKEIYEKDAKTCWYGLVNSDLIDPAEIHRKDGKAPWKEYTLNLRMARAFHTTLKNYYHPQTYAYYGADQRQRAWGEIRWETEDLTPQEAPHLMEAERPDSDGTGTVTTRVRGKKVSFSMYSAEAFGDGTVPANESGNGPAEQGALQCFRMTGFDHQFSYNDPQVRLVTLYSLAKLAQNSSLVMKE